MINDCLLYIFLEFHDHKQKIVKAYKKNLFPVKFQIFEIRGFDSTATIFWDSRVENPVFPIINKVMTPTDRVDLSS